MNKEDIVRMAREAGFVIDEASKQHQPNFISHTHYLIDEPLTRFAALVAAAEREACAQVAEKQEPVAWMYHGIRHDDTFHERPSLIWKPEYMDAMSAEKGVKATPLYTAPRQWQDLTKREFIEAVDGLEDLEDCWVAIEAKLKEKNG